ncbi:glycosyltransferase [uncultured Lamprocystis sp.]|jgi:glycosyltransferase involved in cell wall biosynthesis|uniref:glycosyltransferase n=2 Tax=uncultured Lamprocystis sp. TaxID=543132 RepID=UPI0025DD30B4|nr:glycosyltransferase [uncultured Lamprocystis sp.]
MLNFPREDQARKGESFMSIAVSVVVPAYNASRTIEGCVQSLLRLSAQSPPHEIIVVDNGSDDSTAEIVRNYPRITLMEERAVRGPSAARNAGARAATGDILAFTDADCVVTPDWLVLGVVPLADLGVCGVAGLIKGVEPKNEIQEWMNSRNILDARAALANAFRPYVQTANAFFRRTDFWKVNGFDVSLLCGEDCDLSWRIIEATGGRLALVTDALVYHDHRSSVRGLFRQSSKNARAAAYLAEKWGGVLPAKHWKTSVWEVLDLTRCGAHYAGVSITVKPRSERINAKLDFLHRLGRKHGMIASAWRTGQYSRW